MFVLWKTQTLADWNQQSVKEFFIMTKQRQASQVVLVVENSPTSSAGDIRNTGSLPGSGGPWSRALQYS